MTDISLNRPIISSQETNGGLMRTIEAAPDVPENKVSIWENGNTR